MEATPAADTTHPQTKTAACGKYNCTSILYAAL
jgi:hypothetical protein